MKRTGSIGHFAEGAGGGAVCAVAIDRLAAMTSPKVNLRTWDVFIAVS